MQAGQKFGMQTMNQGLMQAVQDKSISVEEAMNRSSDSGELEQMLQAQPARDDLVARTQESACRFTSGRVARSPESPSPAS